MFGHALKKAFFDLWDHLFFALVVNLAFTLVTLGLATVPYLFAGLGTGAQALFLPVPFLAAALVGGIATFWAKDIVTEGSARFADVLHHFQASWKPSLAFGVAWLLMAAGVVFGVPFYTQLNPVFGFIFGVVMAWLVFFGAGMGLFYPGLNAQVEPSLKKLFKKSFLVFLANPWTSAVMVVVFVLSLVLSVFTLGFFPGILGISIWLQVCFRFVLAKYEWMEKNPDLDFKKTKVPWDEILADDMERVGPRSLKSLIFPWKD
jgi:uncharacterized membrane protein YesL